MHLSFQMRFSRLAALALSGALCQGCGGEEIPAVSSDVFAFVVPLQGADFLSGAALGPQERLVPREYYDELEPLTRVDEPSEMYDRLSVVGVRLHLCAGTSGEEACRDELRLVLQPVFEGVEGLTTRDAAVHVSYRLEAGEVETLVRVFSTFELASVQPSSWESLAGAVHPVTGRERITRLDVMAAHPSGQAWVFESFQVEGGRMSRRPLVGVESSQQHASSLGGVETLDASILHTELMEPSFGTYIDEEERERMVTEDRLASEQAIARILSPEVHSRDTIDCASCHLSSSSAAFSARFQLDTVYSHTGNLRMLGYFGDEVSISPRATREAEEMLARYLSRRGHRP